MHLRSAPMTWHASQTRPSPFFIAPDGPLTCLQCVTWNMFIFRFSTQPPCPLPHVLHTYAYSSNISMPTAWQQASSIFVRIPSLAARRTDLATRSPSCQPPQPFSSSTAALPTAHKPRLGTPKFSEAQCLASKPSTLFFSCQPVQAWDVS